MTDFKVVKGDPIKADTWNSLVDRLPADVTGTGAAVFSVSRVLVPVLNNLARNVDIGEPMILQAFDGDTSNVYDFGGAMLFQAVPPQWSNRIANVAIAAEPILNNEQGMAVISGLAMIKASYDASFGYVFHDPNGPTQCKMGSGGFARVLADYDGSHVIGMLGDTQHLWRYELTQASQAPNPTQAKLLNLDDSDFTLALRIQLDDIDKYMEDQAIGNKGHCIEAGGKFYAIQAVC